MGTRNGICLLKRNRNIITVCICTGNGHRKHIHVPVKYFIDFDRNFIIGIEAAQFEPLYSGLSMK